MASPSPIGAHHPHHHDHHDLLIFGTGAAGQAVGYALAKAGRSVVMIDHQPPGGTCPNRGCDAKKPLVYAAQAVAFAHRMADSGVSGEVGIDWRELMKFKRGFTDPVPDQTRKAIEDAGIILVKGEPSFIDSDMIEVNDKHFTADHFVIAVGLKPRPADFPGGEHTIDSDRFLELDDVPRRVVFIGGGYVGMEFAHVCARLGRSVTVVERRGCPLKQFDHEVAEKHKAATEAAGIAVHCDTGIDRVEKLDDGTLAASCSSTGARFEADLIVNATGRVPSTEGLRLDLPGVEVAEHGVVVDEHLRSTSDPRFFAAGDVADSGQPPLTPPAGVEGKLVAHNLLHLGDLQAVKREPIATIAFTEPTLAQVGLTEAQATEQELEFDVIRKDMSAFKDHREQNAQHAASKVLVERGTDRVLGAAYLGPHAAELINIVTLGMTHGLTATQMRQPLYGYPTPGSMLPATLK